jgi:hypothetical protein
LAYAADDLKAILFSSWSLSGRLLRAGSETDTMKETVQFFGHPQIPAAHEAVKSVEVRKVNTPANENIVTHPRFEEINDRFEITCTYRLLGGDDAIYDEAESDIEDMTEEVVRILKTVYNPLNGTGTFFRVSKNWQITDNFNRQQIELKRVLNFTLTQIVSDQNTVFRGFNGVLSFDDSASTGDTKRGTDYIYTEAYDVQIDEGLATVNRMSRLSYPNPIKFTSMFSGIFRCVMFAKKADLQDVNIDQLDNIYKAQANGELATAVFLHAVQNTEGSPATLTTSSTVKVTRITKNTTDEDLVRYTLVGEMAQPTTTAVS